MAKYMREHAGSRVTLHVANTAEIARRVKNYEIDVGLIEGELSDAELEVTRWRRDELCVFASPKHPLAKHKRLSDADLKSAAWILREQGSGTRQTFERAMHGILPELRVALELEHTEAIKSAVKAGLGLGCVSQVALVDAFKHKSLVACHVPERDFRRYFFFVVHRQKFKSRALASFIELCRND
jgi:DNA-binding transcriptional LysR family regulator